MFFRVQVFLGPGPGFRSSLIKLNFKKIMVQMQVYEKSNILVYVTIIFFFFIKKVLAYEIK